MGLLPEKGQCDTIVTFSPPHALAYDSKAIISYGNRDYKEITLSGIGKLLLLSNYRLIKFCGASGYLLVNL